MSQLLENKITQTISPNTVPLKRRRSERSHQEILTAAVELLQEKGYREIYIEAIASRAGVSTYTTTLRPYCSIIYRQFNTLS